MKRPRSYGESTEEDGPGEKGVMKDRGRRDQESDRLSSHRRLYPKAEISAGGGKGSSYDWSLDGREPLSKSSSRKQFDHEMEGSDRRKYGGASERYLDEEERAVQASSPRVSYSGDRIHRSERFSSSSRRDKPHGYKSEKERSRREGSTGSSWRRSSSAKDIDDDDVKSVSVSIDSVGGNEHRLPSENRGKTKLRESYSGDPPVIADVKDTQEKGAENCSSEMEEGELEPDPEPNPDSVPEPILHPDPMPASEDGAEMEFECRIRSGDSAQSGRESSSEENHQVPDDDDGSASKVKGIVVGSVSQGWSDGMQFHVNYTSNKVNAKEKLEPECEVKPTIASDIDRSEYATAHEDNASPESLGHDLEGSVRENSPEEHAKIVPPCASPPLDEKMENKEEEEKVEDKEEEEKARHLVADAEEPQERKCIDLEKEPTTPEGINLETEAEVPMILFGPCKDDVARKNSSEVTLNIMTGNNDKGKGKSSAISLSEEANSADENDAMEGPSSIRSFELVFRSKITKSDNWYPSVVAIGKREEEKPDLEPLDLSLGLPCGSQGLSSHEPKARPNLQSTSLEHGHRTTSPTPRSIQSLPSSFCADSSACMDSVSFSGSETFLHNPSCSLTQNSMENYEHSVGSHPIFQGIDQAANNTIWQGQPSNESKSKGPAIRSYRKSQLNGKLTHGSPHAVNVLARQSSLPRLSSPAHSHGPRDTRSDSIRKVLKRARSNSSLFKSEQQVAEDMGSSGFSATEKVLNKIVLEPLQIVCRMIQEMSHQSVAYLRESIGEMVINSDKRGYLCALQDTLQKRSDLTLDTLSKCHRVVLEILVTLKTRLPDFLRKANNVPSSDLGEIFLNLKCRNIACRSILPVDECDCKVCVQKNGFCSACMCLVCSEFDLASNTCSWVGCDVCLHWCHTDCALQGSHIRNGSSVTGALRNTEMQFHCVACGHPSEMFGFVKEVFKTCSKEWETDVLVKELGYVRKIFSSSEDSRGKQLCDVANRLLIKLENKVHHSEVTTHMLSFLTGGSNFSNDPSKLPEKVPGKPTDVMNELVGSSKGPLWLDSSAKKSVRLEAGDSVLPMTDRRQRPNGDIELNSLERQQFIDELDNVVRLKEAEAKLYQARADDARREAEGLKRICKAKIEMIEKDYVNELTRLQMSEAEEKRKQKFDELQALEQAHREYLKMKARMEGDVKNLLSKMEATRQNLNM
ncbi:unnamed protein product [Spirodela intermedia]|uniref:Uncharacterized protein n=1 Tax=Spirodela intermedia TaxID=51605 RepID=A0A7I8KCM3_SPIIN|nr:unnamed protein product [Spirodela intermedia]